nr:MAG TPA: hypothetical protein [Caudoviricetes sp.]
MVRASSSNLTPSPLPGPWKFKLHRFPTFQLLKLAHRSFFLFGLGQFAPLKGAQSLSLTPTEVREGKQHG